MYLISIKVSIKKGVFNRYQYKRRTHKRRTPQTSDSTNVGRTKVRPVQTSDQYKRRTSTNVGLVQTSDQYKRRTGTFIRKNVGLGRFWMDHCIKQFQTMNSTRSYSLIPISLQPDVVDVSKNSSWTYCFISRAFFNYLFFYFTYSFLQKSTWKSLRSSLKFHPFRHLEKKLKFC